MVECRPKALGALEQLRGSMPVDQLIMEFRADYAQPATALTVEQRRLVASMPVKIAGRLEQLLLRHFDKRAQTVFTHGQNPFPEAGAKHLHLAGQMLLAGGFTKAEFRKECEARFGWSEGTAFSQVSQALALLRGLALVQEQGERMVLPATV
jgi:hypothetical protein